MTLLTIKSKNLTHTSPTISGGCELIFIDVIPEK